MRAPGSSELICGGQDLDLKNSNMDEKQYNSLVEEYVKIGYAAVGDKEAPYFIPLPSEEAIEYMTKYFIRLYGK